MGVLLDGAWEIGVMLVMVVVMLEVVRIVLRRYAIKQHA